MAEFALGAFVAFIVAALMFRDKGEKRVLETESEAIERIRDRLNKDVADLEQRLVDSQCGWSEGDRIRQARAISQRILKMLPEKVA